jgi:hypothetical protein
VTEWKSKKIKWFEKRYGPAKCLSINGETIIKNWEEFPLIPKSVNLEKLSKPKPKPLMVTKKIKIERIILDKNESIRMEQNKKSEDIFQIGNKEITPKL